MEPWRYRHAGDLGLPAEERWKSLRREMGTGEWLAHQAWWAFARLYLALAQRLRIEGRENVPAEGPFVLVANHTSHLDTLVLGAALPPSMRGRAFPIAAGDTFFRTPALAAFSALFLNALPMWRRTCGPHALETLRQRLQTERCVYILFPEGTRARDGRLAPFRAGLGRVVAGTDVPVVPCHIEGAFTSWPPHRDRPRRGRIVVRIGAPLSFLEVSDDRAGWQRIADSLHGAVAALAPEQSAR